jgi:hypothetical protein
MRAVRQAGQSIDALHDIVDDMRVSVANTDHGIERILTEIGSLASAFNNFAVSHQLSRRYEMAVAGLAEIKQELASAFGPYDEARAIAALALASLDDGKTEAAKERLAAIENEAPDYWLARCLAALSAWLNDKPDLAEVTLGQALRLNGEKTALFFSLVCRKAGRLEETTEWLGYYLCALDITRLDANAAFVLNAVHSGGIGPDAKGTLAAGLNGWINTLQSDPLFTEGIKDLWRYRLNGLRASLPHEAYPSLQKHSATWPALSESLETAHLHWAVYEYLTQTVNREEESDASAHKLDGVLASLTASYDDAEIPLRKRERRERQIIRDGGRETPPNDTTGDDEADPLPLTKMLIEESGLSPSLCLALSRDWVIGVYRQTTQKARPPEEIEIRVGNFTAFFSGNTNENLLLNDYTRDIEKEEYAALDQIELTVFDRYSLHAGGALGGIGLIFMPLVNFFFGLLILIAGGALALNHYVRIKQLPPRRKAIEEQYDLKREDGLRALRDIFEEIRLWKGEHTEAQAESVRTASFLAGLQPISPVPKATRGRKPKPAVPAFAKGLPNWSLTPPDVTAP